MLNWDRKAWASFWSLVARRKALKSLDRVSFLLMYPSLGGLVLPLLLDEVQVRFSWYSDLWWDPHVFFQNGVIYTTNIIFNPWFYFPLHLLALPEFWVEGFWCMLALPYWNLCWICWISWMISWIHLLSFWSLQIEIEYEHHWDPCCNTSLKGGGNYT